MSENLDRAKEMLHSLNWVNPTEEFIKVEVVNNIKQKIKDIKMENLMDKFKLFADLNEDGAVDIADWKKGGKWFTTIYGTLLSMLYVILGKDLEELMANLYFVITFGIIALIITGVAIIASQKLSKKNKVIAKLKEIASDQGMQLFQQDLDMRELSNSHVLELQEKDFQLKIKDTLYNTERIKKDPIE